MKNEVKKTMTMKRIIFRTTWKENRRRNYILSSEVGELQGEDLGASKKFPSS